MTLSTVLIEQMTGQAWMRASDGRLLPLHVGMRISEDSEIVTEDGATVTVQAASGVAVVVGGGRDVALTPEIFMPELSAESYSIREHTGLKFVRILFSGETQRDPFEEYRPVVTGSDSDNHPAPEMLQAVQVTPGERGADQKDAQGDTFDDGVTLIGSDGDDVFAWQIGDVGVEGKPAIKIVKDFGLSGTDTLDISDLLPDSSREGTSLDGYLSVDNEDGKTVINISTKGGGAAFVDQKIVLENIDYDPERAKQIADDLREEGIIKSSPDTL